MLLRAQSDSPPVASEVAASPHGTTVMSRLGPGGSGIPGSWRTRGPVGQRTLRYKELRQKNQPGQRGLVARRLGIPTSGLAATGFGSHAPPNQWFVFPSSGS